MTDLRTKFKKCGDNVTIEQGVQIDCPECLEVGDNVTFQRGTVINGQFSECRIGSNVDFGLNTFIKGPGPLIIGDKVQFYPGCYLAVSDSPDKKARIEIGHNTHFAPYNILYGHGGLYVGPYCGIAAHTVFATVGHDPTATEKPMVMVRAKSGPIVLEGNIWVCANVTITANTRIATGCVIGANAVVTKDTQPEGLYAGVPARRIRDRVPGDIVV